MSKDLNELNQIARTGALLVIRIVQAMLDRDETEREINRVRSVSFWLYCGCLFAAIVWSAGIIYFSMYQQISLAMAIPVSVSVFVFMMTSLIDATLMNKYLELNHDVLKMQIDRSNLGLLGEDVSKPITDTYELMRFKHGGIMPRGGGNPTVMFSECEDYIMKRLLDR